MGLLDAGEVLIDDIMVVESPATTPTNLIQNGTFDTDTNKWRIIGNHHGEVIDDPDQPGNKVLRLVATGSTEHMNNHAETTFVGNRDVVNGREYLITYRAKWVSGSRQLLTRLYFNRLPIIPNSYSNVVDNRLSIYGETGGLELKNEPSLWAFTDRFHTPFSSTSVTRYGKVWGYQYESIRYFVDCVADDVMPEAGGRDGVMVTAMIAATLTSLAERRPVTIAEVLGG
jgi:hypothetical protein